MMRRSAQRKCDDPVSVTRVAPSPVAAPAKPPVVQKATEEKRAQGIAFRGHLGALDGIRGLAILIVLVFHLFGTFKPESVAERLVAYPLFLGWSGVDLFFVLSGFLITGILLDTRGSANFYKAFYMRRVLRILPLYYCFVLFFLVAFPLLVSVPEWKEWLGHAPWLLLHLANIRMALQDSFLTWWAGPLWSLAIEEQFYLFWPFLVVMLRPRALMGVCVGLMVLSAATRVGLLVAKVEPTFIYTFTLCRLDGLAAGAMVALLVREVQNGARLRLLAWVLAGFCGAGFLSLLALIFLRSPMGFNTPFTSLSFWMHPFIVTFGYSMLSVGFAGVLLLSLPTAERPKGPGFLNSRFLAFFGRFSFAMYLLHEPIRHGLVDGMGALEMLTARGFSSLTAHFLLLVPFLAIVSGVSVLSWHLIEARFLALKKYFDYKK